MLVFHAWDEKRYTVDLNRFSKSISATQRSGIAIALYRLDRLFTGPEVKREYRECDYVHGVNYCSLARLNSATVWLATTGTGSDVGIVLVREKRLYEEHDMDVNPIHGPVSYFARRNPDGRNIATG